MTPLSVSVPEAAHLLGLSRSSTYVAVQRGEIPSIRIGGRILIPLRRLEELIESPRESVPAGGPRRSEGSPCEREGLQHAE